MTLDELLTEASGPLGVARGHVVFGKVTCYTRVSKHYLEGVNVKTIDLANITTRSKHRGQGHFTAFLSAVEGTAGSVGRAVYIENVMEERFRGFFRKRGYAETGDANLPCFWKSFEHRVCEPAVSGVVG